MNIDERSTSRWTRITVFTCILTAVLIGLHWSEMRKSGKADRDLARAIDSPNACHDGSCLADRLVKLAPYYNPGIGTQALTTGGSTTRMIVLQSGSMNRTQFPVAARIPEIQVYLGDITNLAGIYPFKAACSTAVKGACTVFRATYGTEITAGFMANSVNTFNLGAKALVVSKGDVLGLLLEYSPEAANISTLSSQLIPAVRGNGSPASAEAAYYQLNIPDKPPTLTLSAMTLIPNAGVPVIAAYGAAPKIVTIGDSIAGNCGVVNGNYDSVADAYPSPYLLSGLNCSFTGAWLAKYAAPPVYQDMGWSGQTSTQILARFPADALALDPNVLIIGGFLNDVNSCASTGCTARQISTIESNLQLEMSMAHAARINKIFVCLGGPWNANGSLGGTNGRMGSVDMVDSWIIANALVYGAAVIDPRPLIGKFRSGGTAGNLWDFLSRYMKNNGLGIHPNASANLVIGTQIYAQVSGNSGSGSSRAAGNSGVF